MKKSFFFSYGHSVVNVVINLKKTFFPLDHDVADVVTK